MQPGPLPFLLPLGVPLPRHQETEWSVQASAPTPTPTPTPPPYLQMTGLHMENPKVMTKPNTQPLEPTSEISKSQDLIVAQKINHVYTLKTNT